MSMIRDINEDDHPQTEQLQIIPYREPCINKGLAMRLLKLQRDAAQMQYEMACMNTLGGAYHLCDHPQQALVIACQQEQLGKRLGSPTHCLRAKGYIAINIGLLGYEKEAFELLRQLKLEAKAMESPEMAHYIKALRLWLKTKLSTQQERACTTNA